MPAECKQLATADLVKLLDAVVCSMWPSQRQNRKSNRFDTVGERALKNASNIMKLRLFDMALSAMSKTMATAKLPACSAARIASRSKPALPARDA